MDVYRGADKVATLADYSQLRVGENKPAFIYEGSELVYPAPVKDGLVLWYDFKGRTNADSQRGVAQDLSGNGNHGTLNNFNYTDESGYVGDGLKFDGVDDVVIKEGFTPFPTSTVSVTILYNEESLGTQKDIVAWHTNVLIRITRSEEVMVIDKRKSPDRFTSSFKFDSALPVNVSVIFTPDDNHIYINGEFAGNLSPTGTELVNVDDSLTLTSLSTDSIYDGSFFSFGIYNRPLTAEEVQHNYQIEKERFNL